MRKYAEPVYTNQRQMVAVVVPVPMKVSLSILEPEAPAVKTVATVVGAVREVSCVVRAAAPIFGVVAY
jgi:hypothetical protein